ncbi:MAG: hypothetical protein R3326_02095 [Gemmatimonadota bacterium]|nr:hypothetical protein [Gemmatimonadota bacterium]
MNRMTPFVFLVSTVLGLAACEGDRSAPTAGEVDNPRATGITEAAAGPLVEEGACPCWTSRSLGAAFPVASFWFEDLAVENKAGRAALQLSDVANARVLQALAEFDPEADAAGSNWCQVGTYGQEGLERESISELKITAQEFAACVTLLNERAVATGVAAD